jgi:hypothetical protein
MHGDDFVTRTATMPGVGLQIEVERSGGFAGVSRRSSVDVGL